MDSTRELKTLRGAGGILLLPEELLWTIMAFLDERTLLTARVVCKQFYKCATCHFKGLTIDCAKLRHASTSNLLSLSDLSHVTVSIHSRIQLQSLAHSRIAPFVTHVRLSRAYQPCGEWTEVLHPLRLLPKLHSLSIGAKLEHADLDIIRMLPPKLQELRLPSTDLKDASPLTRFSGLTHLGLRMEDASAAPSLVNLTGLLSLHSLELHCGFSPFGVLRRLIMLTALTLHAKAPFPDLAHLSGLSQLTLSGVGKVTHDDLACLSPLTKLTNLEMGYRDELADCVRGSSALAPLTGLVCLEISGGCVGVDPPGGYIGESLLPHVKVEALESLVVWQGLADMSVLRRATRLTLLCIDVCLDRIERPQDVAPTIAMLSGLRSLHLGVDDDSGSIEVFPLSPILQALTGLKCLDYTGKFSVGDDLQACTSLPLLRTLSLSEIPHLTAASLPVLQGMSRLTTLSLWLTGIRQEDLTPEVRAGFHVERFKRGWPGLELDCGPS